MIRQLKYKSCCNIKCALAHCETREQGGCYCVCRLKDQENQLQSLIAGQMYEQDGCIIYRPERSCEPPDNKCILEKRLKAIRLQLKKYEKADG